jgi:hypothetical protein
MISTSVKADLGDVLIFIFDLSVVAEWTSSRPFITNTVVSTILPAADRNADYIKGGVGSNGELGPGASGLDPTRDLPFDRNKVSRNRTNV